MSVRGLRIGMAALPLLCLALALSPVGTFGQAAPSGARPAPSAGGAPSSPASPPAPASGSAAAGRQVTIAASGDALLHIRVNTSAVDYAAEGGWRRVFAGFAEARQPGDIGFVNLETPLVDDINELVSASPPILGAAPAAAQGLAAVGVNVLGCANNHAYDQTSLGMRRTVATVREAGMLAVGADATREAAYGHQVLVRDGVRVAFLSFTRTLNRGPVDRPQAAYVAYFTESATVTEAIRAARADADVVVLGVHWSGDYWQRIFPYQRQWAREWVEAGADLILGSGPHILREVEVLETPRGRAVVAYSLGNMVSNQGNHFNPERPRRNPPQLGTYLPTTRDGIVLRTTLRVPAAGRVELGALVGVPMWTENNFRRYIRREDTRMDIRLLPLRDAPELIQRTRLQPIRDALGPAVQVQFP